MSHPQPPRRSSQHGFTLLEVLVALLIAMIGLMGTVAVQQTVLNATKNANDANVAMRLATQTMEELNARTSLLQTNDLLAPIAQPGASATWSVPVYVDASGLVSANQTAAARFIRQTRVADLGAGLPYNVSVQVTYSLDTGKPKTVRLDQERRKSW